MGERTLVDKSVRDTWEMDANMVSTQAASLSVATNDDMISQGRVSKFQMANLRVGCSKRSMRDLGSELLCK